MTILWPKALAELLATPGDVPVIDPEAVARKIGLALRAA